MKFKIFLDLLMRIINVLDIIINLTISTMAKTKTMRNRTLVARVIPKTNDKKSISGCTSVKVYSSSQVPNGTQWPSIGKLIRHADAINRLLLHEKAEDLTEQEVDL